MAEIRKFDPEAGNAIAQALKAAMGEPVRPNEPGRPSTPRAAHPDSPPTTTWVSLKVTGEPRPQTSDDTAAED